MAASRRRGRWPPSVWVWQVWALGGVGFHSGYESIAQKVCGLGLSVCLWLTQNTEPNSGSAYEASLRLWGESSELRVQKP